MDGIYEKTGSMTPQPITNRIMWAHYSPSGDILFQTIAYTKEDSEKLFKRFARSKSGYVCRMIAIDIDPFEL